MEQENKKLADQPYYVVGSRGRMDGIVEQKARRLTLFAGRIEVVGYENPFIV